MSNSQKTLIQKEKVIGLKPVVFPVIEQDGSTEKNDELVDCNMQLIEAEKKLEAMKEHSEKLLADTNKKIDQAQKDWEVEKQAWIEEAKEIGYQEGLELGKEKGLQLFEQKIELANETIQLAEQQKQVLIDQSEPEILELAVQIASKILHTHLVETEVYLDIVQKALQEVRDQVRIKIYSHPEDFPLLDANQEKLSSLLDNEAVLSIYPDTNLAKGDCLIETPFSKLDVSVDSQLKVVSEQLLELLEETSRET
ncbi:flagellar assembly protein FliH [Natronobacillus azotifigens]|uniref:Flagellar assembly protein FliH n=1 Tax=Natronobacillus azotifigens TaxID=472978 RepID=A0A9J6RBF4_9BACI|nr:flagellar assembly protein FliH [Natronobacillus azotifigens]MCZ0702561.1 flagellar assembly protein FliH [Natronobacillus azotifigens]